MLPDLKVKGPYFIMVYFKLEKLYNLLLLSICIYINSYKQVITAEKSAILIAKKHEKIPGGTV